MKKTLKNQAVRMRCISSLLAGLFCLSANAGLYTHDFTDSGIISHGDPDFSAEHIINDISLVNPYITSIQLILIFNDASSLSGNASGIKGSLNLGTAEDSPFVNFYPVATSSGTGSQKIYDVTFSDLNGLNPNGTWGLVLWDNSGSGFENGLAGWSLNIEAVPEPVNVALGIFGGVLGLAVLRRKFGKRADPASGFDVTRG